MEKSEELPSSSEEEKKFSLEDERRANREYLEQNHIHVYLEDAIRQFWVCVANGRTKPDRFLQDYFSATQNGSHVLFRDFAFINCTDYNRKSVIESFSQSYRPLQATGEVFHARDYHSLFLILWPDFPAAIVAQAMDILRPPAADRIQFKVSFMDFLRVFYLQYMYQEFTAVCEDIFTMLKFHKSVGGSADAVKTDRLLRAIRRHYESSKPDAAPPLEAILRLPYPESFETIQNFFVALLELPEIYKFMARFCLEDSRKPTASHESSRN